MPAPPVQKTVRLAGLGYQWENGGTELGNQSGKKMETRKNRPKMPSFHMSPTYSAFARGIVPFVFGSIDGFLMRVGSTSLVCNGWEIIDTSRKGSSWAGQQDGAKTLSSKIHRLFIAKLGENAVYARKY